LIEILVAVTIIGVLFTFTLSALNRAKSESKKIACVSNLRILGAAIMAHNFDHQGRFPDNGGGPLTHGRWMHQVCPYLDIPLVSVSYGYNPYGAPVFYCSLLHLKDGQMVNNKGDVVSGYGINQKIAPPNTARAKLSDPSLGLSMLSITNASHLILLGEKAWNLPSSSNGVPQLSLENPYPIGNAYSVAANHRPNADPENGPDGASNYLFADGHVETLTKWPGKNAFVPLKD